jgi:hypothetical protein
MSTFTRGVYWGVVSYKNISVIIVLLISYQ